MSSKTRLQAFDPSKVFSTDAGRQDALRAQVLPRLSSLISTAISEATDAFGFDVTQYSDEINQVKDEEVFAGLHAADGDFPTLRGVRSPAISLGLSANPENMGIVFRVTGTAEWRLFVKALYQYREALGEYLSEFEELFLINSDGEEEAAEELDQFFAVDVESSEFKQNGCTIFFPGLEYPLESEEDFDTLSADFISLFPFYWTLLKAAHGESVDMDRLLNG